MSYYSHLTLSSLAQDHWTREYKLLSLTYKVLTTTQPPYLHNLISVQCLHNTRCSFVVILARPPSSSSLKITDRSFRYASRCLWNQLPLSLPQPHSGTSSSISDSPIPSPVVRLFDKHADRKLHLFVSLILAKFPSFLTHLFLHLSLLLRLIHHSAHP